MTRYTGNRRFCTEAQRQKLAAWVRAKSIPAGAEREMRERIERKEKPAA